jgi:excisionase family DNA binding protein
MTDHQTPPKPAGEAPAGRLLDKAELAAYLGVSERTVLNWVENDAIPVLRIDRRLRFDVVAIDKWLRRHTIPVRGAA